jgi:tetratricopeptide (TPR) repeat protein
LAGLTAFEVLRAATATPAAVFGYEAGTVAAGRLADLLVVRGNPLEDLAALERIDGVMLDGIWHPAGELSSRLDSLEAAYRPGNALVADALGRRVAVAVEGHRALKVAGDATRADPDLISYVASILRGWGRLDDALLMYGLALEENPESASANEGMARTHLARGRVPEAIDRLERALAADPSRESARALLEELRPPPR